MKLIGKQIVVELPEKKSWHYVEEPKSCCPKCGKPPSVYRLGLDQGFNAALSEVAKMNPAWEVDKEAIKIILEAEKALFHDQTWLEFKANVAHALASNPSAWMKRKE